MTERLEDIAARLAEDLRYEWERAHSEFCSNVDDHTPPNNKQPGPGGCQEPYPEALIAYEAWRLRLAADKSSGDLRQGVVEAVFRYLSDGSTTEQEFTEYRKRAQALVDDLWSPEGVPKAPTPAPDERHIVDLKDDAWTIQHPQSCRDKGNLFDCEYTAAMRENPDSGVRGRWELVVNEFGGRDFMPLEPADSAPEER